MTEFDPDSEIEPEEEELAEEAPEQSSNRTFILVALGLGGLFVIGLICIGLFAFVVMPNQQGQQQTQIANINATNVQVATDAVLTANPATNTPLPTDTPPPSNTPESLAPSDTPVFGQQITQPSATFTATNTLGPSVTPSRTPTRVGGVVATAVNGTGTAVAGITQPSISGGASSTPTRIGGSLTGGTATRTATSISGIGGGSNETRTATPTALPDTGIADNFGGPGLFIAAIVLVAVVFFARQLRLRNS